MGYVACASAGCLWSAGFYFGKIALGQMGVGHMVLYRFLFACLGLSPILWQRSFRQAKGLSGGEWRLLLLASFLGVPVQFLIQFWGLKLTSVSHAALMVGTMPVILAVAATSFTHERLDGFGWLALFGSTSGVGLIVWSGVGSGGLWAGLANAPGFTGDLLVVLSMLIASAWILINQRLMRRHPPLVITAYGVISGTAMLAVWVLAVDGLPPLQGVSSAAWLALAASGVLCTATTTLLWNWGIHHVPASRAGVFLNIEPALGSVLGVKLMGDKLGPLTWVGGALILAAAVMLTSRGGVDAEAVME
ncbi:Permease of the drug/metabolite transporter (DMT) superfamily [Acidisarcina polymorpha]|uniref:Permease of the drug/metabolite transporter (DMT) superfamily n=2 Tax=Acidisarcina polymorpha TaxID=2211140 RepID=A0A2Z5G602_9BACT|nr:Permease of the drug/metabolite transporter (DMT) superfamily [Acidisarcina polymorpha]